MSQSNFEIRAAASELEVPPEPETPRIDPEACLYALTFGRSAIHRWGLFAAERIPAGEPIIEYRGERIDRAEWHRRSAREHLYFYTLDDEWTIDGAVGGSGAEFINHSCDPNVDSWIENERIYLYSLREILPAEELTLDYDLVGEGPEIACICGSPKCRGYL